MTRPQTPDFLKRALPALALAAASLAGCARPATNDQPLARQAGVAPQPAATAQQASPPAQQPRPNLCQGRKSPLPAPAGFVNDFAKVLDEPTRLRLEEKLSRLKGESAVEFAVVTVETTGGREIFDYSLDVACGWGVGPPEGARGGGLLLLVATRDRKWRVQVGRSLERDLPDDVVKQIGDRMAAQLRRGDFGGGISAAVDEHAALLAGRAVP